MCLETSLDPQAKASKPLPFARRAIAFPVIPSGVEGLSFGRDDGTKSPQRASQITPSASMASATRMKLAIFAPST